MTALFRLGVCRTCKSRSVTRPEHSVERFWDREWRMRTQKRDMRKPRPVPLAHPADEFAGQESGLGLVAGIGRRRIGNFTGLRTDGNMDVAADCIGVAARPQPGEPLSLMLGQKLAGGEARQHTFIGRQVRIIGIHAACIGRRIGISKQRRVVPRPPGRQRQIIETGVERRTVAADAVVHLIEAGIKRRPRR